MHADQYKACMRMRKLGKRQSVIFCILEEVKSSILKLSEKHDQSDIDVSDVLQWAIAEIWMNTSCSMPLWVTQGQQFKRQCMLWNEACQKDQLQMSASQAEKFLEPESQALEQCYQPRHDDFPIVDSHQDQNENIQWMLQQCHDVGNCNFTSIQLQKEQE